MDALKCQMVKHNVDKTISSILSQWTHQVGSDKNIIAIIKVIMEYIVLVVYVIYTVCSTGKTITPNILWTIFVTGKWTLEALLPPTGLCVYQGVCS